MAEQSYQSHRQYVPGFHFVTFGILVVNIFWALWRLFQGAGLPVADRVWGVVMAIALALLAWYTRTFPMRVQDRVIRLEERLRIAQLLPPDLASRIGELRPGQLVALRFAGDEEIPELTRKVLAGELRGGEEIKKSIRHWRPDHLRA
ncbi:MAG TPA: DUF6526 family protein [Thermoanaerobaculia bacterium]|nr:DUF6526 family protein [Thermoanaerobaculia bacterium]